MMRRARPEVELHQRAEKPHAERDHRVDDGAVGGDRRAARGDDVVQAGRELVVDAAGGRRDEPVDVAHLAALEEQHAPDDAPAPRLAVELGFGAVVERPHDHADRPVAARAEPAVVHEDRVRAVEEVLEARSPRRLSNSVRMRKLVHPGSPRNGKRSGAARAAGRARTPRRSRPARGTDRCAPGPAGTDTRPRARGCAAGRRRSRTPSRGTGMRRRRRRRGPATAARCGGGSDPRARGRHRRYPGTARAACPRSWRPPPGPAGRGTTGRRCTSRPPRTRSRRSIAAARPSSLQR